MRAQESPGEPRRAQESHIYIYIYIYILESSVAILAQAIVAQDILAQAVKLAPEPAAWQELVARTRQPLHWSVPVLVHRFPMSMPLAFCYLPP